MITALYVLYDDECGFCCACARWLIAQPKLVNVECVPRSRLASDDRFPGLRSRPGQLTVVDDDGGVYEGDSAWLMAMWSLTEFRPWSARFASPELRPLARETFAFVSQTRHGVNTLLGLRSDAELARAVARDAARRGCVDGGCAVGGGG